MSHICCEPHNGSGYLLNGRVFPARSLLQPLLGLAIYVLRSRVLKLSLWSHNMLTVATEPGGYAQLCHVCPPDRLEPHEYVIVVLWKIGMIRLCPEHVDELIGLLLDALGE